jgi:hypothetical protein
MQTCGTLRFDCRAREKIAVALLDENVQDGFFKCRIGRMTVCFPAAIADIEFDATTNWITAVYSNCSIAKIRSGFAIPNAELDNVDFFSSG